MVELKIDNLYIQYEDFKAVNGVSFTVKDSEIVTLLGPSGCGKTSILRAIAGFVEPTKGKILLDNKDITHTTPQSREMGMIFQNYALWPHMTVEENVSYGLKIRKVEKENRIKKSHELLEQVHLLDQAKKFPTQLSGGQQQRIALARALAIEPKVLLCDEPLSNLDFKLRVQLRTEIREIAKNVGVTVVYVTHDQTEALAISDKVAVMDFGKIIQFGTPFEVYNDPETKFVANFVGENNEISGIVKEINNDGIKVEIPSGDIIFVEINDKSNLKIEDRVDLVTRFDNHIFMNDNPRNPLHGILRHIAYMGKFLQIEIDYGTDSLFTINVYDNIKHFSSLKQGTKVSVDINSSNVFVFKDGYRVR